MAATVRVAFPCEVEVLENVWIPLSDGCRLAARLWRPADAGRRPVPSIIEYIPYRKRFGTRWRDEPMHRYFAGHGYASLRVDLRGSGESDGILLDEYLEQEQRDGVELIEWVASQPWCSGAVGMMGKSWGGFNSLQIAALDPAPLKAIITVCSTDDRYSDDAHYMGGCLLNENLIWGSVLYTINALPPDPDLVGGRWRDMWLERLNANPLFVEKWLQHQRRDDYWSHGSVCEDWSAIRCPVYAVGGWADGYTNAVFRMMERLSVPRKGLVGPWAHVYPHNGVPGPSVGFLQEAVRWWDHWLLGHETGVMDEPMLRVWMQDSVAPSPTHAVRPGRWIAEEEWPSPDVDRLMVSLTAEQQLSFQSTDASDAWLPVRSPLSVGLAAGNWCGFGVEGDAPGDQRDDDARSLTFDSKPLAEKLEILGSPEISLLVRSDAPLAMLAVRLNDVLPDGSSARVSYGLLNLTHRESHLAPEPLEPGKEYRVTVRLNDAAHVFPPGNRVRVAISNAYWPMAWPSPRKVAVSVAAGGSHLLLPLRPPQPRDAALPPLPDAETAPGSSTIDLEPGGIVRTVTRDEATGETVYCTRIDDQGPGGVARSLLQEIELEVGHAIVETFRVRDDDPISAHAEIQQRYVLRREGWSVRVETCSRLRSDAEYFYLEGSLSAREDEHEFFSRRVERRIAREGI